MRENPTKSHRKHPIIIDNIFKKKKQISCCYENDCLVLKITRINTITLADIDYKSINKIKHHVLIRYTSAVYKYTEQRRDSSGDKVYVGTTNLKNGLVRSKKKISL